MGFGAVSPISYRRRVLQGKISLTQAKLVRRRIALLLPKELANTLTVGGSGGPHERRDA